MLSVWTRCLFTHTIRILTRASAVYTAVRCAVTLTPGFHQVRLRRGFVPTFVGVIPKPPGSAPDSEENIPCGQTAVLHFRISRWARKHFFPLTNIGKEWSVNCWIILLNFN